MTREVREKRKTTSQIPQNLKKLIDACQDAKGSEIALLDVSTLSDVTDFMLLVNGRSDRQTQGIANKIIQASAKDGVKPTAIEGLDTGHWILIDLNDVIIHVFHEPMREHYNLEGLWMNATRFEIPEPTQQAA